MAEENYDTLVGLLKNKKNLILQGAPGGENFRRKEIGDYSISWNLNGGDAFAISEEPIHEAGCIHTSQGLEFDYTGVIIGDDMRFENGKVITDYTKRAKTDNSLKGIKTLERIRKFTEDRDWDQFYSPANLARAFRDKSRKNKTMIKVLFICYGNILTLIKNP